MRILVWFRNDLRVRDNAALSEACKAAEEIIPFYCFDEREYTDLPYGFSKTGAIRTQFRLQSVQDLRNKLQEKGGDLVIRSGKTADHLQRLCRQFKPDGIYLTDEWTTEEIQVEEEVRQIGVPLKKFESRTLYHRDDLPFKIEDLPWVFTDFRKAVEKKSVVHTELAAPKQVALPKSIDPGPLPDLAEPGLHPVPKDPRSALSFKGGEAKAWERLEHYFWQSDGLAEYKETRNGMIGADYSSKFSPWLAQGCISARSIYHQVQRYEKERVQNQSTYWMIFELLWRDFFQFTALKEKNNFFRIQKGVYPTTDERFTKWRKGETGQPFIDGHMKELWHTGFMSNRGRQNAASYLIHDLEQPWYAGALWFQSQLIDYDVYSNYGNWTYLAGIGHDPRKNRYFNPASQAKRYDEEGAHARLWKDG